MPKISALTSLAQASVDTAADVLPIVDATAPATTKKVTVQAMVNAGLAAAAPQGGIFALTGSVTVSGTAGFAAGTAAAPSVKVGAEQNGLYSSAANTLDVTLGGVQQAQFAYTASAVNYWMLTGSSTGDRPDLRVQGSDTNIGVYLATKGTGSWRFATGGGDQFRIINVASAVNYAQITGSATGNAVRYGVEGSDSNVTWAASSKGTFGLGFYTNGFSQLQFAVGHIASAVNYLLVQGSGTGLNPALVAQGSDANIGVTIASKGSGNVGIYTGTGAIGSFYVTHTASGVNWVQTTGSTTGNAVSMTAGGSDANIDFLLGGKGTGVLRFGTHSAIAAETVTGYITIKDSAGNTRKLAVVS